MLWSVLAFIMEGSMGKMVVPLERGMVYPWVACLLVGNARICIGCSVFPIPHKKERSHQDECSRAHQGKGRWWRVPGSLQCMAKTGTDIVVSVDWHPPWNVGEKLFKLVRNIGSGQCNGREIWSFLMDGQIQGCIRWSLIFPSIIKHSQQEKAVEARQYRLGLERQW